MTRGSADVRVEAAAISDRGLNERRPHNEDSMLNEPGLGIFAVADGVGGAESGEVASQTAVDVLREAFSQKQDGDDVEDLLEIAIQRANDSIYRASRQAPGQSMMATTIVALYLDGLRATVGHVGDSRLYRLTPDGELRRETADHSVVEDEVRAGRMTAAQAANHPSRNIISRALGAEPSVEVDLQTFDFEEGTLFLLCSDGITRHIGDEELQTLLSSSVSLDDACAEMKRLCFERGAEDNLTAVLVRAGSMANRTADSAREEESTLVVEREKLSAKHPAAEGVAASSGVAAALLQRPFHDAGTREFTAPKLHAEEKEAEAVDVQVAPTSEPPQSGGGSFRAIAFVLISLALASAAFYGGMRYQQSEYEADAQASQAPAASQVPSNTPAPESSFEERRRAVDRSPAAEAARISASANGVPLNSNDPEMLYLYGRAMLLTGNNVEAALAFERAIQSINASMTPSNGQLKIDAGLARVASKLRANDTLGAQEAARSLDEVVRVDGSQQPTGQSPAPAGPMSRPPQ